MDLKQIQQESLDHYKRMQDYVLTLDLTEKPDCHLMFRDLDEDWFLESCSYCSNFIYCESSCPDCPLNLSENKYFGHCCNELWYDMSESKTWAEWLIRSFDVVEFIKEYGLNE